MRTLIVGGCLLLLPSLALAQFPGFGQPDAKTPTFSGSSTDGKWTSSRASKLETEPGIATPRGGQGGPVIGIPPRVGSSRPQTGARTGGGRRGGNCPRQSSFVGPLVR